MNKEDLKMLEPGALAVKNPIVQASGFARSSSPGSTFPGNRLQGTSGTTSAPATVATGETGQAQHPLLRGTAISAAGAGRGFINPAAVDPAAPPPKMEGKANVNTTGQHPMTNFDRTGMSNAQVAEANPAGRVTMTRQPDGTMSFSGGDVSGPVSYMNSAGNPLVGGGLRGNGFSRMDSVPAGAAVGMDDAGNYAFSSGNPIVSSAGQAAPAAPGQINRATASPAASGSVDAALGAAAARGDFDAVRAHYAGRGQAVGSQAAEPGTGVPAFEVPVVRHSGNDWAARNALRNLEVSASSITNRPEWRSGAVVNDRGRPRSNGAADPDGNIARFNAAMQADLVAQGKGSELQLKTNEINAELQRAAMSEQGANSRHMDQLLLKQQGEARESKYQNAQLDFAQQRLAIEQERASKDGLPQGYRRTADGGLESIPGGPADPAVVRGKATLNDVQSKALQFGARMLQSGQALDQLSEQGVSQPGYIKRAADVVGAGALANWTQSPQQQQVEQSQRDYVNAVLRRESGAAISNSEFDNARKQYFPQPGDSAQVIEQKRRNRELATQGVLAEVPDQQNRVQQVLGAAGQGQQRTVVRTGMANGRRVLQYSDGSISYAN